MESDKRIFTDLEAINEKWTKHAADRSECGTTLDTDEAGKGSMIDEMKEEIEKGRALTAQKIAEDAKKQEEIEKGKAQIAQSEAEKQGKRRETAYNNNRFQQQEAIILPLFSSKQGVVASRTRTRNLKQEV